MTNDELRRLAEAAREVAPGEWIHQRMRVERPFNGAEIGGGGVVRQKDKYSPIFHGSFASELGDYIAAMNPERAIELLDEVERLREANANLYEANEAFNLVARAWAEQASDQFHKTDEVGIRAEKAEAEVDRLRGALEMVQWGGEQSFGFYSCPRCHQYENDGHAPDCELRLLLQGE